MQNEPKKINQSLLNFLKGFGLVLFVSLGLGLLGALLFGTSDTNQDLKEIFRLAMMLGLLALLTIGGQLAFLALIEAAIEKRRKVTFMHALGGISAWVLAFYCAPLALDYLAQSEDEEACETVFERKLGPITFSKEECPE